MFEVKLTKREFDKIIKKINAKLKKTGIESIEELAKQYISRKVDEEKLWRKAIQAMAGMTEIKPVKKLAKQYISRKVDEEKLWRKTLKATGRKEFEKIGYETGPLNPMEYLFHEEASQVLSNKFVRRGLKWLEKHVSKQQKLKQR